MIGRESGCEAFRMCSSDEEVLLKKSLRRERRARKKLPEEKGSTTRNFGTGLSSSQVPEL